MSARKAFLFALIVSCIALGASSCSHDKKDKAIEVKRGLAARVGDIKITEEQMIDMFDELPQPQRKQFKGPEGQAAFVDRLIEQTLLYQAALDDGLDKTEEMKDRIRLVTMNVLVAEYYSKKVLAKVKVDKKDIKAYYESHPAEFTRSPVTRAQYLFTVDSLRAVKWQERLAKGENFSKLARAESEDGETAPQGGDTGYFNPGGYIKGVGRSEIFSKAVEQLEVGKVSGIIHLEKGFAIVRVTEKNPVKMQTLDEATETIERKLRSDKAEAELKETVEKLMKKHPSENYVRERLEKTTRTPEELWEMAQIEPDARTRIQFYRDIVNLYPNHKNAPEALFMIGFTYAEELTDYVQARRVFNELERTYPNSEIVESAKWMKENMEKAHQKLESMEGVQKQVEEDKVRKSGGTR
jgi:peptidyl-prolyl cis-trans isomerase C